MLWDKRRYGKRAGTKRKKVISKDGDTNYVPLSVWWCPCYCLSLVTSLPVAFISVALSCHLFSTDNGSAASLWGWHKKAYYGKIKCNLKHPWFQGLLTQTHHDWCVYPIMDTHTYACFALHPFVPNAHVCKCTEMHTWPTARYSVFFLSLSLSAVLSPSD